MKLPSILATALLPLLLLPASADPRQNPSAPAGFDVLPMKVSQSTGFRYITIRLNGKEVNLLVDSGCAGQMVISKRTADALGAKQELNTGGTGISGEVQGSISVFDSLKVTPDMEAEKLPMNVLDMPDHLGVMQADGNTPAHYGILGAGFLDGAAMAYVPAESMLLMPKPETAAGTFRKHREAAGDQALPITKGPAGEPLVILEIKGKALTFLIDTGAQGNCILPEIAKELELPTRESNRIVSGVSSQQIESPLETDVNEVVLAGKQTIKLNFLLLQVPPMRHLKAENKPFGGILGNDVILHLNASLDFDSSVLLIPGGGK